jgi:hypothetical protein
MVRPVLGVKGAVEADPTELMDDRLERQRKEESRIVKGIFQDNDLRGGHIRFFFKKFKGDEIKEYIMEDGKEYEVPLAVAKHLNSGCAYETHSRILGPDGMPTKNIKKNHRFAFKQSEFC